MDYQTEMMQRPFARARQYLDFNILAMIETVQQSGSAQAKLPLRAASPGVSTAPNPPSGG